MGEGLGRALQAMHDPMGSSAPPIPPELYIISQIEVLMGVNWGFRRSLYYRGGPCPPTAHPPKPLTSRPFIPPPLFGVEGRKWSSPWGGQPSNSPVKGRIDLVCDYF